MSVTIKDIQSAFPEYQQHEQVDSKQLFICSHYIGANLADSHNKILVSYRTIVGYYDAVLCTWVLTKQRYNLTTSKQLNQFARNRNVTWVDSL